MHQYATAGAFNVTLTTTNGFGSNTVTQNSYVVLTQPCVTYCAATGSTFNIWLTNVSVRRGATVDLNNSSAASTDGYGNYVDRVVTLYQGQSTTLSLSVNAGFQHLLWAWVDWNRNGTFETAELVLNQVTTATTFAAPLTVSSATASRGFTRMRVMVRLNNQPTPTACQVNQNNSETEDYSVLVTGVQATAEAHTLPALTVFPNPSADGHLRLRLPDPTAAGLYAVRVDNVVGARVLSASVRLSASQDAELNLAALPPGLYVLRLQDAQGNLAVRRVQIQ